MGYVRVETGWQYRGCDVLRLESELLRIDVFPQLGGKIYRWVHKPADRDYLWQHPRIKPMLLPPGTNYDDNWSGGWDELFPNGAPGEHAGEIYPDHGEYWTRPFDWEVHESGREVTLHLWATGAVTPTRMDRWIRLEAGSPAVRFSYRLTHLGEHPFDYLWSLHPALSVRPGCRLLIPAERGIIAAPGRGRLALNGELTWPDVPARAGGSVDFSRIPAGSDTADYEMVFLTDLHAGWYALLDPETRSGFGLAFDHRFFTAAWVFQTHGGWRGLHTIIVEPCTGYPYGLAESAARGRCARLLPGQVVETQVAAVVLTDRDEVAGIDLQGKVS